MDERLRLLEELNAAIRNGMERGRRKRRSRMRGRWAASAAAVLVVLVLASVRFSPAVAAYVETIPGLKSLVGLLHGDEGLEAAIEHDFMQPLGLSEVQDQIKVGLNGYVADESQVILFYTLENRSDSLRMITLADAKLLDVNGEHLKGVSSWGHEDREFEGNSSRQGRIDIAFTEEADVPDLIQLELVLDVVAEEGTTAPTYRFDVPIDRSKFEGMKETYELDETVEIEGQRITFERATVYPTRIGVEVSYDPNNSMKILHFDDIAIYDGEGSAVKSITNGVTATYVSEHRSILYFQSNYFTNPERMYIRASSIRALEKERLEVRVDLESGKLLRRPDARLTLLQATDSHVRFRLEKDDPMDANRMYGVFYSLFHDASGKEFHSSRTSSSGDEIELSLPEADYENPIALTITDYPNRIRGEIEVRVK